MSKEKLYERRDLGKVLAEIRGTVEEVVPEFVMYQHPLYHGFPLPLDEELDPHMRSNFPTLNEVVRNTVKAWNRAIDEEDWHAAVMIITPRPFRLHRLLEIEYAMRLGMHDGATFCELVRDCWIDCEHPYINADVWRQQWAKVLTNRFHMHMYQLKELNHREMSDEPFRIYRGHRGRETTPGLSWTTDRERAVWFANRWQDGPGEPHLTSTVVSIDEVIGPFMQRGEEEYILTHPKGRSFTDEEPSND